MSAEKVRLSIDCFSEERKKIKILSALKDMTISEWVMDCIRGKLKQETAHIPNKKTAEALRNSAKGKGTKKHATIEELFSTLDM